MGHEDTSLVMRKGARWPRAFRTPGMRVAISAFVIAVGLGLLSAETLVFFKVSPEDGRPGLSRSDVRLHFAGGEGPSSMEVAVHNDMRQYLGENEEERRRHEQMIDQWIIGGADEEEYHAQIGPIMANNCARCHSSGKEQSDTPLTSYEEVVVHCSPGDRPPMALSKLSMLTHVHLFGISVFLFLLAVLLNYSRYSRKMKLALTLLPFAAMFANIGGWWMVRAFPMLDVLVIVGGGLMSGSTALVCIFLIYDQWARPGPT